jgi:PAS domain S-box-containing protein
MKLYSHRQVASSLGLALLFLGSAGFGSYAIDRQLIDRQLYEARTWTLRNEGSLSELLGQNLELTQFAEESIAIAEQSTSETPIKTRQLENFKPLVVPGFILLGIAYLLFRQKNTGSKNFAKAKIPLHSGTARAIQNSILERVTDGVVALDRDGQFTYVNQRAGQILCHDSEDLVGENIWEKLPQEMGEAFYPACHRAIEQQQFIQIEVYYSAHGRWFENRIYPSEAGITIFFQDVTSRKKAEIDLQQAKDTLEVRVTECMAELAQSHERLAQASVEQQRTEQVLQSMTLKLEQSHQELEQFVYTASHDLQEPLRAIAGYSQLLQQEYQLSSPDPALLSESMLYIGEGVKQMRELMGALLAYSRAGTQEHTFLPVDCNHVLAQVLDSLQVTIAESSALVTYDSLPTLMADQGQIIQLFQNLISNAIKFNRESPPIVHISAQPSSLAWQFSVQDNGIGIKPQYLERIFEVFRRLHTRREYTGTGMGLAICKKVVECHGGRLWAESDLGRGTVFHFTIPVR